MKVFIGADHRGYKLKNEIKSFLITEGFTPVDLGALSLNPNDNYPDFAERVASIVSKTPGSRGILICGSGVGVDIVANKFDGIRAGMALNKNQVKISRMHDDINILILASDFKSLSEAKKETLVFLSTKFDEKERHKKRIEEIKRIEENN